MSKLLQFSHATCRILLFSQLCDFASFIEWFKVSKHIQNSDGTNVMIFCISGRICVILNIGYDNETTKEVETTFLDHQLYNNINWKI